MNALARGAQGLAAGGQDMNAGRALEDILGQVGGRFNDVLAVVEHEQQFLALQEHH